MPEIGWIRSSVFVINFGHISRIILFPLLTFNNWVWSKTRHESIITRVIYPASRLQLSCEQTSNIFCSVREVDGLPLFIRRSICEKGT